MRIVSGNITVMIMMMLKQFPKQHGSTTELGPVNGEEEFGMNTLATTPTMTTTGVTRRHVGTSTSKTPPPQSGREHLYLHHVRSTFASIHRFCSSFFYTILCTRLFREISSEFGLLNQCK